MVDHVTDEAVRTVDATVDRSGPVDRPRIVVPAAGAEALPTDDVVRVVLDGSTYRARPVAAGDRVAIPGVYDTPAAARDPADARNHLPEWIEAHDLDYGRTVHLDVIDEGRRYGLRAPGQRATYEDHGGPDESLASIAERLDRE